MSMGKHLYRTGVIDRGIVITPDVIIERASTVMDVYISHDMREAMRERKEMAQREDPNITPDTLFTKDGILRGGFVPLGKHLYEEGIIEEGVIVTPKKTADTVKRMVELERRRKDKRILTIDPEGGFIPIGKHLFEEGVIEEGIIITPNVVAEKTVEAVADVVTPIINILPSETEIKIGGAILVILVLGIAVIAVAT